jgi:hypothetical protein
MFAQPTTDASKPTIKLPDTADPDVVGIVGRGTDIGTALGGDAAAEGAGAGCVEPPSCGGDGRRGMGFRVLGPAWPRAA